MTVIDRFGRPKDVPANYVLQEGETSYIPMAELHNPARTRCMGDAALAAFFRDGGMGGGKPDAVPAGFYRDGYGRLLATGTGPERDRAEGFRIARDAMLADAYKAGDDAPAAPAASLPDAKTAYDAYIADITNAHRRPDPDLSGRAPVAFGGGKRRESA